MDFDQDTSFTHQTVIDRENLLLSAPRVPLNIVDDASLIRASNTLAPGRSQGHKVKFQLIDGGERYFYYKMPFDRIGFVKELVVGALARLLLGNEAPLVCAVEKPHQSNSEQSQYTLISEILSTTSTHDNLERWARLYYQDEEALKIGPKHMGLSLAFKLLVGDSDAKLANFVLAYNGEGLCYSIDHEYTFNLPPVFIRDAGAAVRKIKDFNPQKHQQRDVPLQEAPEVTSKIGPLLCAAVKRDVDDGSVMRLYERFVRLTSNDIETLFEQFGSLISMEERAVFQSAIQLRQRAAEEFIEELNNEKKLVDDFRLTIRGAR
jgi:hypothetical protein